MTGSDELGKQILRRFSGVQYRGQPVVREHVGADFDEGVVRCQQPQGTSYTWETQNVNPQWGGGGEE